MSNITIIEKDQTALNELHDMLKARYGRDTAQEIVETIKATLKEGKTPEYMLVKVLSEMVEQFLGEAHAMRAERRQLRAKWIDAPENVTVIELRHMEADFRQIRRVWWISAKLYRAIYEDALRTFQESPYPPRKTASASIETAMAA